MKKFDLNSTAVSVFLCANPLSWFLPSFSGIIIIILLLAWGFVLLNGELIRFVKMPLFIHLSIATIFLFFLISYNINYLDNATSKYFGSFLIFGVTGIFFSQLKFSIYQVLRNISIISIPVWYIVYKMDFKTVSQSLDSVDYGMWMGVSYGLLRLFLSICILILFYRNKFSPIYSIFLIILLVFYVGVYFAFATRGAILSIMIFLFSYYFVIQKSRLYKNVLLFLSACTLLTVYYYILDVIVFFNSTFNDLGFEIRFFSKMQVLLESGNIDNGRVHLVQKAVQGIVESPLWGNGIASFEEKYGYYVHNFFLQLFYEGGILFALPILLVLFVMIRYIYVSSRVSLEEKIFLLFLVCSGLIELFFSSVLWRSVFFWFSIFYCVKLIQKYKVYNGY